MARRLAAYVHVADEGGENHVFGPDDKLPAWAVKAITNPKAWAEDEGDDPDVDGGDGGQNGPVEPPRAGKGSGVEAWLAYAKEIGVTVADGAGRDDVIAAVDAAAAAS